jgi:uncharacterized protein YkwD
MRINLSIKHFTLLALTGLLSTSALASEESQLVDQINTYRNQVQRCTGLAYLELPPLMNDSRLILPLDTLGDLQQALAHAHYPMSSVQVISLSGPRSTKSAMTALQESFCKVILDPQFVDIGVSREGHEWRIALARQLLSAHLGEWQAEGMKLLEIINSARTQSRQCGTQSFTASTPLVWSAVLATAAENHSRSMANKNFFDHKDRDGRTPGDRAELAGYNAQLLAENIAAGQDSARKVVDGWLNSPGHCANLMSPAFYDLGAAYAVDTKSDAGIYWTAMFGSQ